MNIVALGVGKYGNAVAEQLCANKALSRCAAICSSQEELEAVGFETKFRVSTRLSPCDAVERIRGKLKKACAEADVVILIANPADFADSMLIFWIAKYIQSLNITLVSTIVYPSEKMDRKRKNAIKITIPNMVDSFATALLRQEAVAEYVAELNTRWLNRYTASWRCRDTIQEQEAFHTWKASALEHIETVPDMVQVGVFTVCRLLNAMTAAYANADEKNVIDVLSVPGLLHFAAVYASGEDRDELIKRRSAFNDMMSTSSHAARGMLLDLTVPDSMTPEEAGKICLGIYGYADENVNFYFNINHTARVKRIVAANVLATGTHDGWDEDY